MPIQCFHLILCFFYLNFCFFTLSSAFNYLSFDAYSMLIALTKVGGKSRW